MFNQIAILRVTGMLEGLSLLILVGICMPLKYIWNIPEATSAVGMAHGLLFLLYCAWVVIVGTDREWGFGKIFLALLASIVPFGTFVADKKLFRDQQVVVEG